MRRENNTADIFLNVTSTVTLKKNNISNSGKIQTTCLILKKGELIFLSDVLWFTVSKNVKIKNSRFIYDYSYAVNELPVYDSNVGVWCVVCAHEFGRPISFKNNFQPLHHYSGI